MRWSGDLGEDTTKVGDFMGFYKIFLVPGCFFPYPFDKRRRQLKAIASGVLSGVGKNARLVRMAKKITKRWRQEWTQPLPGIGGEVRARRHRLGLTYEQLADAMGIHWTTLRNWELGKGGRQRNPQKTRLVRRFLSGEYDEILQRKKEGSGFGGDERELLQLCQCFYHLHCYHEMLHCLEKAERWGEFQEKIEEIVRRNAKGEKRNLDSSRKERV